MSKEQSKDALVYPAISFGEECHPGLKREDNQDSVAHATTRHGELFLIADGVGGYFGGAEASKIVTSGFPRHMAVLPATMAAEAVLSETARRVNAEVFAAGQSGDVSRRRMSSTVVLALLTQQGGRPEVVIGNVGDSRAYLVRGGQMMQLSSDHTAVQGMLDAGVLTPLQAKDHPHASVLTRTMGQAPEVVLEIKRVTLQADDQILLCSDGLHAYAKPSEILSIVTSPQLSPAASARALVDLALAAGGPDNISVQVVRLGPGRTAAAVTVPPEETRPNRTIPLAIGGAAAVLLASVAGVKYYEVWQSKPVASSTVTGQQTPAGANPTNMPKTDDKTLEGTDPKGGTHTASRQPVKVPNVGGLVPARQAERTQYLRYKAEKKYIHDVDQAHQASCEKMTESVPVAYYLKASVLKESPANDPELKSYFTFKPYTPEVESVCGRYDLLLLPIRSATHLQQIKDSLKSNAKKSEDVLRKQRDALEKKIDGEKQDQ